MEIVTYQNFRAVSGVIKRRIFGARNSVQDNGLPVYNSDFGVKVQSQSLFRDAVGDRKSAVQFTVDHPLEVAVYSNEDGFTAILSDFDAIFGYGENANAAIAEVKTHLWHLRKDYGALADDKCTAGGIRLREKLKHFLKEVPRKK